MNDLGHHLEDMRSEWLLLRSVWDNAQTKWKDDVATAFHRMHWTPLECQVNAYLRALEEAYNGVASLDRE